MRALPFSLLLVSLVATCPAIGDEAATEQARAEYVAGTNHVKAAKWGEAIAAFERSRALRRHALTTFNIAACERALGRYTRARRAFRDAVAEDKASGGKELGETFVADAKTYLGEIDGLLAKIDLTVSPGDAAISFDGRPLLLDVEDKGLYVTGLAAPGPGSALGATVRVLTDPGAHVLVLARKGYSDVLVNRTFPPGSKTTLALELEKLPGIIKVRADRDGAVVTLDGLDIGTAPVQVSRSAGSHTVVVRKTGYATYSAQIDVRAGEELDLRATLAPETIPITKKWWFWTIAGGVVAGAAVGTYFLVRPAPTRPPIDGGGLGWAATVQ